jgi:hypothetical protein
MKRVYYPQDAAGYADWWGLVDAPACWARIDLTLDASDQGSFFKMYERH